MSAAKVRVLNAALKLYSEKRNKDITVSDLAREAKVARSTIYNLFPELSDLFGEVANQVTSQFNDKLGQALDGVDDPALMLACSLSLPLQEFHQDPLAGRFVTEFAYTESKIRKYWFGVPNQALQLGVDTGRFKLAKGDINLFRSQMSGGLLSMMILMKEGHLGWREAASGFVFYQMRALGLGDEECQLLASKAVPAERLNNDAMSV